MYFVTLNLLERERVKMLEILVLKNHGHFVQLGENTYVLKSWTNGCRDNDDDFVSEGKKTDTFFHFEFVTTVKQFKLKRGNPIKNIVLKIII